MWKRCSHEMLACFPVIFNEIVFGLGAGWVVPMLVKLQETNSVIPITQEQASWIASIPLMGRIGGPLFSPLIVDNLGRKYSTALVTVTIFLIWFSLLFVRNFYFLCLTRLISGITGGISDVVSAIYVTENCSTESRSVIGAFLSISYHAGSVADLIIAQDMTYQSSTIVNTVISTCSLGTLYFCTETPSFLIMKKRYEEAERNLLWLRGDPARQESFEELKKLKENVQEERAKQKSFRSLFSSSVNVRSFAIVLCMTIVLSLTGGSAIGPYMMTIFQPYNNFSPFRFTLLNKILEFVALLASPYVVSRTNRRTLLIVSFSFIAIVHMCTCWLIYIHSMKLEMAFHPWLIFLSVTSFNLAYAISSPALFIIKAELLPLSIRAVGSSSAIIMGAISGFAVAKTFQPLSVRFGMGANFFIYSCASIFFSVFVYTVVPETRGKSLHEIHESLKRTNRSKGVEGSTENEVPIVDLPNKNENNRA